MIFFVKFISMFNFRDYFIDNELIDHCISNGGNSKIILNIAHSSNNQLLTPISKISILSSRTITEDKTRSSILMVINKHCIFYTT